MELASAATADCIVVAGQRRWRVAAADVMDVLPWPKLTPVPLQPAHADPQLLGIFEWNNSVVPVFDIARLSPEDRRRVVIVRATVNGTHAPLGLAAADVANADEAGTAEVFLVADLVSSLPKARR